MEERLGLHKRIFSRDSPEVKSGVVLGVMKGTLTVRNVDIKSVYIKTEWLPGKNYTGNTP